jgi:hypothetical protein
MQKQNPQLGLSFDDFFKQEGVFDEVQAGALAHALTKSFTEGVSTVNVWKLYGSYQCDIERFEPMREIPCVF